MNKQEIEQTLLSCILLKPKLLEEFYLSENYFSQQNKKMVIFLKKQYELYKDLDFVCMVNCFPKEEQKQKFMDWYAETIDSPASPSFFYEYQDHFERECRKEGFLKIVNSFTDGKIDDEEFTDKILQINNEQIVTNSNKKNLSCSEILALVRSKNELLKLDRLSKLDDFIKIRKNTINIIGARPSEGKSALALNLFCDYAKKYKCLYFNMEMTETEVYERMIGIMSNQLIKDIKCPPSISIDKEIEKAVKNICNLKYEIVGGSKSISSIKSKIIREQREEHLIVFIDYVGYVTSKAGLSDKDRIGEVVRELNGITKDYNCTIFLIAQINRNGNERPTLIDLKDSGELEQTADTVILIHDPNKMDTSFIKKIILFVPKCRSGTRNIQLEVQYDKSRQRFSIV